MVGAHHLPSFQSHVIRFDGTCFVSIILYFTVFAITMRPFLIHSHTSAVIQQNKMVQIQLLIHFKLKDCEYNTNVTEIERERQIGVEKKREKGTRLCCSFQFIFACILHCIFFTGKAMLATAAMQCQ